MKPWIEGESHVLLVGDKGVGKNALAENVLLSTGLAIRINCTPDTCPKQIVQTLKNSCHLISNGSSKVLRTPTNNKVIIYLKNLELLRADKWKTKPVIAFLTQLMSYNGFYDNHTFDWIQLDKFQVVATCVDLKHLDARLVSHMHVVDVQLPDIDELLVMFSGRFPADCPYSQAFSSAFAKTLRQLNSYSEDGMRLDLLRIGIEIIDALNHYNPGEVSDSVLRFEFWRAFQSQIALDFSRESLESALSSVFGTKDKNLVFVSLNGSPKLNTQTVDQFVAQITKTVKLWVNETEAQDPSLAVIPETIALFAESNRFLRERDNRQMCGLALVGNSGSGRKLAIRATAHAFGFDTVWSPKQAYSDKQLSAELSALIGGEEEHSNDKKVLLIVDEIHFQLIPQLRDKIYTILSENIGKSMVRIVLILSQLRDISEQMWSRVCHVCHCQQWSKESLIQIPRLIIPKFVTDEDFSKNFYKIYQLFGKESKNGRQESRRFLALIDVFAKIFETKLMEIDNRKEHLKTGVEKLEDASNEVEKLRTDATEQRQLLSDKRREADDALNLITNSMHASEDQRLELEDIKAKTEKETQKLQIRKKEIDAELQQIEPVLMQAKAAVGSIRSESLAEIRSLRAPPEVIRDILEGVLRLMGVNDTSWVSMKSFLSRRGVKDEIMNFESRKITPEMRQKVCAVWGEDSQSGGGQAAHESVALRRITQAYYSSLFVPKQEV